MRDTIVESTTAMVVAKSVSSGGLSMLLLSVFDDVEFVLLLSTGIFSSVMSFYYDYENDDSRKKLFTLKEAMVLYRYIFYGIPIMFLVYYLGVLNIGLYITLPVMVWGFIGMVAAASAITIVEFFAPLIGGFAAMWITKGGKK